MRSEFKIIAATAAALVGFAGNSILCRMALGSRAIDASSFTFARLAGGTIALFLLARLARAARASESAGNWISAAALFAYVIAFSLAYLRLGAGVGALVLFASVQATMIGWTVFRGERPSTLEWLGIACALAGFILLELPGAAAPDLGGFLLMMLAGIAWGVYSLRGRGNRAPLATTADNFARSTPFAIVGLVLGFAGIHATTRGIVLALASGAITSGIGYSLWYFVLPALGATRAAVVQLLVPVLAAVMGVVLLDERIATRFVIAGTLIMGGVAIVISTRRPRLGNDARSVPSSTPRS